mmetsp:Transcript_43718/g.108801  ORF Transcript_43718/g.108801 Transcript_43718/m.108801 type:complete len:80 (-) Transcript_43718:533-772(-)
MEWKSGGGVETQGRGDGRTTGRVEGGKEKRKESDVSSLAKAPQPHRASSSPRRISLMARGDRLASPRDAGSLRLVFRMG